ncbi:MAG TPA: ankyrin repeat domain-containing protein [Gemmatimonadaceae bacterium]|nr:ankyrin repeat domain-containing protein [Gemmatimonadaceae bacterium]
MTAGDAFAELAAAVRSNDVGRAKSILASNPSLSSQLNDPAPGESFGGTILRQPVEQNRREMIDLLVRSGADVNARSHWWAGSFGPIDAADASLVPFLRERGAVLTLHAASRLGMIDEIERILRDDPRAVHARGGDGQLPLHYAANIEVASVLLDAGADIDAVDVDHESTAAQWAIRERTDVARFLVSRGAKADILLAAALGDVDLVRSHLDKAPASVRSTVSDRYFPKTNPRAGGTIYIWTLGGHKTAHQIAREFGHENVFALLMSRTRAPFALAVALELGDERAAEGLIADNPGIVETLADEELERLPVAAQASNVPAVRRFLDAGWPVDATMPKHVTALHWAGFHGDVEIAKLLLARGAPLAFKDGEFDGTPLDWAMYGSRNGWGRRTADYPGVVNALLDAGAKVHEEYTASEPVLEVLRAHGLRR